MRELDRRIAAEGIELIPLPKSGDASIHGLVLVGDDEATATDTLRSLSQDRLTRIIAVTSEARLPDLELIWRLREAGAAEVLSAEDPLTASTVAARMKRWSSVDRLLASPSVQDTSVGRGAAWIALLRDVIEIAAFTHASVVFIGESGTGKEHLAQLVHDLDPRPEKKHFITVDCTTIVPELSGSEFFGHDRGAYTGAIASREGAFALAHHGTLFLDEVGELPLGLQAQLLRVVQEGTYKRLGGSGWSETRFRLVCATNVDLAREVGEKRFRLDFYHRIGSWVLRVPPLRERPEDIVPLAQHFMHQLLPAGTSMEIAAPVRRFLLQRRYPGNVRELRAMVARMCGRHVGPGPLTIGDIPSADLATVLGSGGGESDHQLEEAAGRAALSGLGLKEIGRVTREAAIRRALAASDENIQTASKLLKVTDRALQLELAKRDN